MMVRCSPSEPHGGKVRGIFSEDGLSLGIKRENQNLKLNVSGYFSAWLI